MNDSQFEDTLRALRPSAPAADSEERIGAGLCVPEPSPIVSPLISTARKEREPVSIRFEQAREPLLVRCFHSLGWAMAGAASAVAAIALFPAKPAREKPEARTSRIAVVASARPVAAESTDASASSIPAVASAGPSSPATGEFQAMEVTRELVSTEEDEQLVYRNGNTPMRQVHYLYREHHSWVNPRTGARVEVEVPREDVFLKPVSLQ